MNGWHCVCQLGWRGAGCDTSMETACGDGKDNDGGRTWARVARQAPRSLETQWRVSWASFCRADWFFDSWWRTDRDVCQADPARVDLNSYEMGLDLGCQGLGGRVCLSSNQVRRGQAEVTCSSCHPGGWLGSDTMGPPQTANAPKHSNFGLSAWAFQQGSLVGHYWLGMDVLQKLRGFGDWSPCPQAIQSLSNHVLLITVPYVMMSGMWIIALRNANLIFRVISLQRKPWCSVKVWIRGQEMRY